MKAGPPHRGLPPTVIIIASVLMGLLALLHPHPACADGCFLAPPFVWDKHRDINEPTQKAILVYDVGREDLILQVKYAGPVDQFGWLVPVPGLPTVKPGAMASFYALSRYTQEHWEPRGFAGRNQNGDFVPSPASVGMAAPEPVQVLSIKTVGAYEVAVLSATEPGSLEKWLAANQFAFPREKAEVIDSYVKQRWYFVAVKIDLRKDSGFQWSDPHRQPTAHKSRPGVAQKLATGELPPLQISFRTDRCVFPLKISSVNGTPSEVQVYVLSPEPLVERRLFEKKFPEIKRQALEQSTNRIRSLLQLRQTQAAMRQHFSPQLSPWSPSPIDTNPPLSEILKDFVPDDDLPHYGAVTLKDLPKAQLSRLAGKTWWLTKQTWTFQPAEMADLYFQPAAPVFAAYLSTEMGYYAVQNLAQLGPKASPAMLSALHSTNTAVRIHAASLLNSMYDQSGWSSDPAFGRYLPVLFHDPEREVRAAALAAANWHWQPPMTAPLLQELRNPDNGLRHLAMVALINHHANLSPHQSELMELLQDPNLNIRADAIQILEAEKAPVPRPAMLSLLQSTNLGVLNSALLYLKHEGVSQMELLPLLHHPLPVARAKWINTMREFEDISAIDDLIPLLRDPDPIVQHQAWQLLHDFTGQTIPQDQPDQWTQWWATHHVPVLIAHYTKTLKQDPTDGSAYHDRACLYNDLHDFPKALADFRQAAKLGNQFQDYSHYRIWLIRTRQGETAAATAELTAYLRQRPPGHNSEWPLQVGNFLAGQLTEAAFLQAANNPTPRTDREQHCEAWYYAGMKRLLAGDRATATQYFKNSLATGINDFEEYQSANAELNFLAATK